MNISKPVASTIEAIDFSILSPAEILRTSVKRLTNPQAIDPILLHPQPNGLYDTALGAFLDHACATCQLDTNACPGHCGHIELPVHVYHCQYMDQVYKLVKAQCTSCGRLRAPPITARKLLCKLRLVRHGLLKQAEEIDDICVRATRPNGGAASELSDDSDDDQEGGAADIIERQEGFTRREIRRAIEEGRAATFNNEAGREARRILVHELIQNLGGKGRKCPYCSSISPTYRKNASLSIYRKPLAKKELLKNAKNSQLKLGKHENALTELNAAQKTMRKKLEKEARRREAELRGDAVHSDEGIADMDVPSQEEDEIAVLDSPVGGDDSSDGESLAEGDDVEFEGTSRTQAEEAISAKGMIEAQPTMAKAKKRRKDSEEDQQQQVLNPEEVRANLQQLFKKDADLMGEIYGLQTIGERQQPPSPDMFFVKCLLVPPNKYRKETKTAPDEISEAADNAPYRHILAACQDITRITREIQSSTSRGYADLQNAWLALQGRVNALIDVEKAQVRPAPTDKGIKQKLEKKEGIMRMNVMGKRVNFAARSVISPDPNLEANEVGVPPVFAKKLTYPEPVTTHNFSELKQAVINGASKWPGAVAVEFESGQVINLRRKNIVDRQAIANSLLAPSAAATASTKSKKVHRHLNNGDVVLMNRQPTLHKPSMMAHRARVLRGEKTIRMHYANTNSYNADFDGDEMNMHFPQNEIARAEAMQIADTDHQYLSTTSGGPLRGLIQDHISMGVWLTCQDSLFTQEEYFELLYSCLKPESNQLSSDRIKTIDPSIWKPATRWTGKDVITTILANIQPEGYGPLTVEAKCQVDQSQWGAFSEEGVLRISKGCMLSGSLDKNQIGAKAGGLVHATYEAYGHIVAGRLISILGRLLTRLLAVRGFSCGIEDLIVSEPAEAVRQQALKASEAEGPRVAARYVLMDPEKTKPNDPELLNNLEEVTRDDEKLLGLDAKMRGAIQDYDRQIVDATVPGGLCKPFPSNQMQTMTASGAKGSKNNAVRISALVGQQNLEGRRVPIMSSGRTLPTFKPFEPTLRAGGFVTDRFLSGVRPQEYYFHAMSGREGLVDTAVKTSRSGYLQRCVIKGLEGCQAGHDGTVRDADGTIVQALYGEDALEVSQQAKITDFSFVARNFDSYLAKLNLVEEARLFQERNTSVREHNKDAEKAFRRYGDRAALDPATALYPPTTYPGSTSESYFSAAKKYIGDNPDKIVKEKKNKNGVDDTRQEFLNTVSESQNNKASKRSLETVFDFNYLKAVVPPGDAIGVVAGQSIGEPSTQMTLNTFHMAGSAQNVTLGIPRLREILMTASQNLKTPQMVLHFIPEITHEERQTFVNGITRRSIAELIDEISVDELVGKDAHGEQSRVYRLNLNFFPKDEYAETYSVSPDDVVLAIERRFIPILEKLFRTELRKAGQTKSMGRVSDANPEVGKSAGRVRDQVGNPAAEAEGGESDADDDGDGDATNAKRRANNDEGITYDDPDESEEEIERAGEREASPEEQEDEGYGGSPHTSRENTPSAPGTPGKKRSKNRSGDARDREQRIVDEHPNFTGFQFNDEDDGPADTCTLTIQFPPETTKLGLLPLAKQAAHTSLIQELAHISAAALVVPREKGEAFHEEGSYVATEGVNLSAMRSVEFQNVINPHRIYTNSVHDMLINYGVEAARDTIIKELQGVFGSHGITVNRRHLTLVADYMTRAGNYLPFNRNGMRDDISMFKKMSFETTVGFLKEGVIESTTEDLLSPSARLTVGRMGAIGTGGFDVMLPVNEDEEKKAVDSQMSTQE